MLPRAEAEHLTRVLRLGVGDIVRVFDGRGRECFARVAGRSGRDVRLHVESNVEPAAEATVLLTIVQAVLKGEKMDAVVRDAVMLGAAAIQPIVTRRTETTASARLGGARLERWRRVAIASVKQSGRAVVPAIHPPLTLDAFLERAAAPLRLMLIEPTASTGVEPLTALQAEPVPAGAEILVGPEGGWEGSEVEAARARGVRLVTLGRRTMRADVVPIAAISVLQFIWGDL